MIDKISEKELLAWLRRILSAQEYDVICRRNAIVPYDHVWTLQEIGDVYGILRERVRQLERAALVKARKKIRLSEQHIRKRGNFKLCENYCRIIVDIIRMIENRERRLF